MNEENVRGGKEYEISLTKNKENHIFALESDSVVSPIFQLKLTKPILIKLVVGLYLNPT
jgi:hypothetical protein